MENSQRINEKLKKEAYSFLMREREEIAVETRWDRNWEE